MKGPFNRPRIRAWFVWLDVVTIDSVVCPGGGLYHTRFSAKGAWPDRIACTWCQASDMAKETSFGAT